MPFERFYKLPEERRHALLSVATREFAEHGYEQASFNRIVREAGVSKGAMYYYFADKEDLYTTVIEEAVEQIVTRLGPWPAMTDREQLWRTIREMNARVLALILAEPELARLGRSLYASSQEGPGVALEQLRGRLHDWLEGLLSIGQGLGAVRDDVPRGLLTDCLVGMLFGADRWFDAHWDDQAVEQLAELGDKVIDLCRSLVEPEPPVHRRSS